MSKHPSSKRINFRCSPHQFQQLSSLAQAANLPLTSYLIEAGLSASSSTDPHLRALLVRIASEVSFIHSSISLLTSSHYFKSSSQSQLTLLYLTNSTKFLYDIFFPNIAIKDSLYALSKLPYPFLNPPSQESSSSFSYNSGIYSIDTHSSPIASNTSNDSNNNEDSPNNTPTTLPFDVFGKSRRNLYSSAYSNPSFPHFYFSLPTHCPFSTSCFVPTSVYLELPFSKSVHLPNFLNSHPSAIFHRFASYKQLLPNLSNQVLPDPSEANSSRVNNLAYPVKQNQINKINQMNEHPIDDDILGHAFPTPMHPISQAASPIPFKPTFPTNDTFNQTLNYDYPSDCPSPLSDFHQPGPQSNQLLNQKLNEPKISATDIDYINRHNNEIDLLVHTAPEAKATIPPYILEINRREAELNRLADTDPQAYAQYAASQYGDFDDNDLTQYQDDFDGQLELDDGDKDEDNENYEDDEHENDYEDEYEYEYKDQDDDQDEDDFSSIT